VLQVLSFEKRVNYGKKRAITATGSSFKGKRYN